MAPGLRGAVAALAVVSSLAGCGRARPWAEGAAVLPCERCHAEAAASGAHARHAMRAAALPAYGDLRISEDVDPVGTVPAAGYGFGCGHCHPLDPARHMDGYLQVELSTAGAPAGIKAESLPEALYDSTSGACSGVYCHSTGQPASARVYGATPPWDSPPGSLGCSGCHGNPPLYPNGGMGSDTANTHVPIGRDGHFGTVFPHDNPHGKPLPDPNVGGRQGGAFTCQVCHYESVDPTNTGPSGFYWLDVTAEMPPWGPCTSCHVENGASPGWRKGRAWPLRHVNGRPDVVFDPRQALPDGARAIYDGKPFQPLGPYWYYRQGARNIYGPDVTGDGAGTSWAHVANAVYQRVDAGGAMVRTCSNVSCHLWDGASSTPPYVRPRAWSWGQTLGEAKCGEGCHYLSGP